MQERLLRHIQQLFLHILYVHLVGVNIFLIYCMRRVQRYIRKITVNSNIHNVMLCILLCYKQHVCRILLTVELLRCPVILEGPWSLLVRESCLNVQTAYFLFLKRTVLPLPILFLFSVIQTFFISVLLLVQYQSDKRAEFSVYQLVCRGTVVRCDVYVMFNTFTNVFFYTLNSNSKSLILFSPVL